MANYSATFSGDLTTYIAGKIFDAANMAKEEKERSDAYAKEYGVEPEKKRGEFFARALQSQFGGDLYNRTLGIFDPRKSKEETDRKSSRENRYSAQFKYPDRFAKGQSVVDPLIGTPTHLRNLPEYQRIASPEERKFKSESKMTQTARPEDMFGGKDETVKVKDQKLGIFLAAVAESINASITGINQKLDETESGVIEAKEGIAGTIKKLEYNADSLEQRLDAIIATLREQMQQAKKQTDKSEIRQKSQDIKTQSDMSGTQRYVGVNDNPNDVRQLNLLEDTRDRGPEQLSLPLDDEKNGFERGGIATGPDSGYYAKLHGNEMIVPLDNNYTQGEPSAVDGKLRPKPKTEVIPKYELGTKNNDGNVKQVDDMFKQVMPSVISSEDKNNTVEAESEKLYNAMQLPVKATGIVTLGLLQNALGMMGPLAGPVAPLIKTLSSPIASSFGVPDTVTDKVVKQQETETAEKTRRKTVQSTPSMSTSTSGAQSSSGSGFQWWNPLSWFRGNSNNNERRTGGTGGGILNAVQRVSNFISNPVKSIMNKKPKGLSVKGVQAGFTGMAKEGFDAIMGGDKFRLGKWKPQILGRGAYSAPTLKGAMRYAGSHGSLGGKQTPGGVVKSIVPGNAPRINFLEPQARVAPATFDKGKVLADKLLSGAYSNSPLANKLRNQLISGTAKTALGGAKLGGRLLGILGPILDLAFPEPTAQYDQLTGPNAYYNAPGYKGPKPFNPPQETRNTTRTSNAVNATSKNTAIARLSRPTSKLDPIVINNLQNMSTAPSQDVPIRPISTVGNHGLSDFYPSVV